MPKIAIVVPDPRLFHLDFTFDRKKRVPSWKIDWRNRIFGIYLSRASAPSLKSLGLRRRSVGCFSRRERSAAICLITVERATQKNSQLAAARRVALKMGRLLRCSSVTYRSRYAPSSRLADDPFWTQPSPRDLRDGASNILFSSHLESVC
jgi:hypothetical protein